MDPSNKCLSTCCDPATQLCLETDKSTLRAPLGCIPESPDPCVSYTCDHNSGQCAVDTTCQASCGCSRDSVPKCSVNRVNTRACGTPCNLTSVSCTCGSLCGAQCDDLTGSCTGSKSCSDGNSCTLDQCSTRLAGTPPKPTAVCSYVDLTPTLCPAPNACVLTTCNGTTAKPKCTSRNVSSLIDFCGTCLGGNLGCVFTQTTVTTGTITVLAFAPALGIAAFAASIALLLALRRPQTAGGENPLAAQALQSNPTFKEPGLIGEMPAV